MVCFPFQVKVKAHFNDVHNIQADWAAGQGSIVYLQSNGVQFTPTTKVAEKNLRKKYKELYYTKEPQAPVSKKTATVLLTVSSSISTIAQVSTSQTPSILQIGQASTAGGRQPKKPRHGKRARHSKKKKALLSTVQSSAEPADQDTSSSDSEPELTSASKLALLTNRSSHAPMLNLLS